MVHTLRKPRTGLTEDENKRQFIIERSDLVAITSEDIANLMITAFEGGATWAEKARCTRCTISLSSMGKGDGPWYANPGLYEDDQMRITVWYHDGMDSQSKELDRAAILAGLKVMEADYPAHFDDVVQDNHDAITADVFLQCVVFGEMVYG